MSVVQQLQWAIESLPVRWARASDPTSRRRDLRVARELKYHDALYDFLARQPDAARIDEAKNAAVVQVVDKAVERKSGPRQLLIIAITATLSFLLAGFVVVREAIWHKRQDPVDAQRLATLNQYLRSSF